ncbi:hypothetical protein M3Y99_00220200 [Aphelenchoides fujianensis]|nr:hypothetical protein M3Y99_00220200 [Aphelenchoides fujianensis]
MEAAVVKPKPRIRPGAASVRDGLNRFLLFDSYYFNRKKTTLQLMRLASLSRAQLTSVRRSVRGIRPGRTSSGCVVTSKLSVAADKAEFWVGKNEMGAFAQLLNVPVSLFMDDIFLNDGDGEELKAIKNFVNGLIVSNSVDSPHVTKFIKRVAPQLKRLKCYGPYLEQFPPLDLEKLVLHMFEIDYNELRRHKIRRLDTHMCETDREYSNGQILSESIKSLGLTQCNAIELLADRIEAFCRRFPALEDLHIICDYALRDQLNIPVLKRLFFNVKHRCEYFGTKTDWIHTLEQAEPFDKATFTIDRTNNCVRMFLKHNEPRGPKPFFFHVKGSFWWLGDVRTRNEEANEGSSGDEMEDDEAMDEEFDDSSEDATDESEASDQDGMDDADGD